MHQDRLLAVTHTLTSVPSRRDVLRGLAGAGFAVAALRKTDIGEAKKKRKKHKRQKPKLKRNEFGCVDVGGKCLGNDANCCSGICEGKKPKKGKKDTSVCVAHDTGICFPDTDSCLVGFVVNCSLTNENCICLLTTGNAGFCGEFPFPFDHDSVCRDCSKDTDCQDEFGPGAACVNLSGLCSFNCPDTDRTACLRPCPEEAP